MPCCECALKLQCDDAASSSTAKLLSNPASDSLRSGSSHLIVASTLQAVDLSASPGSSVVARERPLLAMAMTCKDNAMHLLPEASQRLPLSGKQMAEEGAVAWSPGLGAQTGSTSAGSGSSCGTVLGGLQALPEAAATVAGPRAGIAAGRSSLRRQRPAADGWSCLWRWRPCQQHRQGCQAARLGGALLHQVMGPLAATLLPRLLQKCGGRSRSRSCRSNIPIRSDGFWRGPAGSGALQHRVGAQLDPLAALLCEGTGAPNARAGALGARGSSTGGSL